MYLENYSSDFHQILFRTISAVLRHYIQISAQTVENWETSSNHKICTHIYIWNSENAIFVFRLLQNVEKVHSRAQLLTPIVKSNEKTILCTIVFVHLCVIAVTRPLAPILERTYARTRWDAFHFAYLYSYNNCYYYTGEQRGQYLNECEQMRAEPKGELQQ